MFCNFSFTTLRHEKDTVAIICLLFFVKDFSLFDNVYLTTYYCQWWLTSKLSIVTLLKIFFSTWCMVKGDIDLLNSWLKWPPVCTSHITRDTSTRTGLYFDPEKNKSRTLQQLYSVNDIEHVFTYNESCWADPVPRNEMVRSEPMTAVNNIAALLVIYQTPAGQL